MKIAHINPDIKSTESKPVEETALYQVLKELPKPESNMKLNPAQKKWWYWLGAEFISTNQFSKVDLIHLQNASVSMDVRCKMIEKINAENKKDPDGVKGWVQKFATGATNVSGYQTMYEKATKQLDDVSAHFGLSIKDRSKIKSIEKPNDTQLSLFDEVMKKLHG